jgi:hypothetical protein
MNECTVYVGVVVDEVVLGQTILRACSLCWDFMQSRFLFYYWRFGTTYRPHGQESRVRECLTLESVSIYSQTMTSAGQQNESPVVKFWKSTTGDIFCWPTVLQCINCTQWRWPFKIWNMLDLCILLKKSDDLIIYECICRYFVYIVILVHGYEQDNMLYFVEHWNKHVVIQISQPTRCKNVSSFLLDVYVQLNMFWVSSRPSSGAQQLR